MRRREFVGGIAGVAAWPIVVRAQDRPTIPRIGLLGTNTVSAWGEWVAAFVQRLSELGWIEGRTITIDYRWADGRSNRYADIAKEFVRAKVDVIVTSGAAVPAAKEATSSIPIVFAVANHPGSLVASLGRPGANVTGLSLQAVDLSSKRLGLLREVLPGVRQVAVFGNSTYLASVEEMREVNAAATRLGVKTFDIGVRNSDEIAPAITALKTRADALYVITDPLISTNRIAIYISAVAAKLPTIHSVREYVAAGGFISYGPSYPHLFRRAAEYVDKILRGHEPGVIPVEEPTKFEFIVNVKTARALDLIIPESLLARADEVIE